MNLRHLNDLTVFLRVVEAESFSAAARTLHIAPKSVSKQIARLEQALGISLFERNTRNLKITDEGQAIAERARVAMTALDEIQELATSGQHELSGIIRLTAPAPFGRKYVAPAISAFCRLHPGVGFELKLSDQIVNLFNGTLDLAIRLGALSDSRLLTRKLADNRRVLAASPAYLHHHGTPTAPDELARHACLLFSYPGLRQDIWPLEKNGHEHPVSVDGRLSSDNGEVLHEWCLAGLGISLRETWDIAEELHDGRLVRILPEWEISPSQISVVRVRREPVPRRLSVFIDFLAERWHGAPWERLSSE